jgi:hypothetical protein
MGLAGAFARQRGCTLNDRPCKIAWLTLSPRRSATKCYHFNTRHLKDGIIRLVNDF